MRNLMAKISPLILAITLSLPIWSQSQLPPADNDWWKTDEGKAWVVFGNAYLHGVDAYTASAMAGSKPIQPLYEMAQNQTQAVPTPPAQVTTAQTTAPLIPVGLPPDVVKAIQTALANAASPPVAPIPAPPVVVPALSPDLIKAIETALATAAANTSTTVVQPSGSDEPSQVFGVGIGVQGLGPAQFQGGYFVAQHVATGAYAIEATDFVRMPGGDIGTSATAGVFDVLHRFGPFYVGVVGTAGAAEGATGSASGALSGWGVLGSTFGSKPIGLAFAAQTTKVAGAPGPTGQFKLYFTFAWSK